MLAIRMQRTGRKGYTSFRIIVQESRLAPTSGRVVTYLGSYDPHRKIVTLNKAKAEKFLTNGVQPSPRAARLLEHEGVTLPDWVPRPSDKTRAVRNPDKLRKNRPAAPAAPEAAPELEPEAESEAEAAPEEAPAEAASAELAAESPAAADESA
jgi:small subunit ribosomal protein S16